MKKITIKPQYKKMLSDIYTPVGIYLRLRDRFRDTILLESADNRAAENSFSFICINAIGGIEISNYTSLELKYPGKNPEKKNIENITDVPGMIWNFMNAFDAEQPQEKTVTIAQSLFGYTTYDAVQFFDTIQLKSLANDSQSPVENQKLKPGNPTPDIRHLTFAIPLMRYRLYQYVIIINHFKDEMFLCENVIQGLESEVALIESLIKSKDVPSYPFKAMQNETSNMSDEDYMSMVRKGIQNCYRGDVFQIVLSRKFQQNFTGDEFNVYRALRSINPSPYLFYFDYGDYKLIGSSPESQLIIKNGKAVVHPIAGTFKRTGNDEQDNELAAQLLRDAKENAEHTMLVDLARNDLSKSCENVAVSHYREVQYYSHVIHLVSEVTGKVQQSANPFQLLATTFPAGTLSGAPKFRAMELIDAYEPAPRSFYGGCIGSIGFNGDCNHAIMIRTFLSKNNTLIYQAGAGIVAASQPQSELQEVNNKLGALKNAISLAEDLS